MIFEAVIFDMDGTLIESPLNIQHIRGLLSISAGDDLIVEISRLSPSDRDKAFSILEEHEYQAAWKADLIPGAERLLNHLCKKKVKTALLTRNSFRSVQIVQSRYDCLAFDVVKSRENPPIKPDPESVLTICNELGVSPNRICLIGDYKYDVEAANRAGVVSVFYCASELPDYAGQADIVIRHLEEAIGMFR